MTQPRALIITAPGTNRDADIAFALAHAGAQPEIMPLIALREQPQVLRGAQLIVIPGGFSYADALGAGRIFAWELRQIVGEGISECAQRGVPVLGICNGFQVLVRLGVLPGGVRSAALAPNRPAGFQCRWVTLSAVSQRCAWTAGVAGPLHCPIAHGEGRFICDESTLRSLRADDQIALTYADGPWSPANPNGSIGDIAGVCDGTGMILGLMPHPENAVLSRQHPQGNCPAGAHLGSALITRGVDYARG